MRLRDLALNLDDPGGPTLKARIARALEKAIREGRLKPGTVLPGSRSLADGLGVTRNTVVAALEDLVAEGWLVSEPWRGMVVAPDPTIGLGAPAPVPGQPGPAAGFDLPSRLTRLSTGFSGMLNLADGAADSTLAPREEMAKAYQRAVRLHGRTLLGHGEPQGNPLLREVLAEWASERLGVAVGPERIVVTRGGRAGFRLVAEALLKPGDAVGVEEPGNRATWETLIRTCRAEPRPLPIDGEGALPDGLEAALRQGPLRMIHLSPRRQYPTGAVMGAGRARALLDLAARHRIAVFEDDGDAEIAFGEGRTLPLLALDTSGQVLFGASLSRLVAPGVRLGFLVVPPALASHLARMRKDQGTQGDQIAEWAFADLIRDGELARHLRRVRRIYEARRDFACAELRRELGAHLAFQVPDGGMALWLRTRDGMDLAAWVQRARGRGLLLKPPGHFYLGDPAPATRLGFAQVEEAALAEAVQRLKQALPEGA